MRASRLVSLLLLLQTRGQLTAGELAQELEVSERTVHRDVEALSASGVPIYAERGAHGGIRLVDGYRTRLTGMTGDEAEALFLAGLPGPAAELGLGTVVAAAQLKVLASLPPELRTRASRLVERFHLDAGEWFHTSEPVPYLAPLSDAVWNATRIAIDYDRGERACPSRDRAARARPEGRHLVRGRRHRWRPGPHVSRLAGRRRRARRRAVRAAGRLRPRPATGPTPRRHSSARRRAIAVDVRVRPDRLDQLRAAVGHATVEAAEPLPGTDPDGWLRLRLRLDWPDEAPVVLLRAGRWVEVLGPPEVRARVASTARAIAERYADDVV